MIKVVLLWLKAMASEESRKMVADNIKPFFLPYLSDKFPAIMHMAIQPIASVAVAIPSCTSRSR